MKYIYWFKQQAVALVFLAICWSIGYILASKLMGNEAKVLVLTPDLVVGLISFSLTFIFIGPFIYKWWDPLNKDKN